MVATLVAAFWSSGVSLAIYGLIAVYYLFEHLPSPGSSGEPDDPFAEPDATFGQPG